MLKCACLFVDILSGLCIVFVVILVSKKGPMCLHLFVCYNLCSSDVIVVVTESSVEGV